jgi:hypothetical protein
VNGLQWEPIAARSIPNKTLALEHAKNERKSREVGVVAVAINILRNLSTMHRLYRGTLPKVVECSARSRAMLVALNGKATGARNILQLSDLGASLSRHLLPALKLLLDIRKLRAKLISLSLKCRDGPTLDVVEIENRLNVFRGSFNAEGLKQINMSIHEFSNE